MLASTPNEKKRKRQVSVCLHLMKMEDLESIEQDVKNNLDSGELEGAADDTARLSVSAGEQEVIGLLLHTTEGNTAAGQHPMTVNIEGSVVTDSEHTVQAVTLADGTTAYIQPTKVEEAKFLEGTAVTLDDGTTAIMHTGLAEKAEIVPEPETTTKFVDGQPVQLEDGSTAYLHHHHKEGLQPVQLEDGTTAYIAHTSPQTLFGDATNLEDPEALHLENLNSHVANATSIHDDDDDVDIKPSTAAITVISNSNQMAAEKALAIQGERSYRCAFEGCGRLYTTQHHLKVHERSHTGDRPFKCEFTSCGKAFATGYGLKSHTRVHTGEKPYKCPKDNCDKAFKTSGDLQKHVRTHTGERPFKCPFVGCARSFTTSNIRKVHIRTHTGERPYTCREAGCGRAFASATNYKNHVRIHTGEKPYVCTVQGCGKRFTEYSSLYKHHVVHTHSKPYVCNHCGKTYRQTSTLAMHKRTAHGEEVSSEGDALYCPDQALDISYTVVDECMDTPKKKPRLHYNLTTADATGLQEDGEGTLVINTSDSGQVCYTSEGQQITMMAGTERVSVVADDNTMVALQAIPHPAQTTINQHGVAHISLGDHNQHVFVVTDPSQLQALQQLAEQQHQVDNVDGLETFATATDNGASQSVPAESCIITNTVTDPPGILAFHTE